MPDLPDSGHWRNTPPAWERRNGVLRVRTGHETDYWDRTFYGFTHDNGHFLARAVAGDFSAEAAFTASYEALYDQAGLMVRSDARNWMKAGIELTDGLVHFSVVVTRDGWSDWSVIPLDVGTDAETAVRVTRHEAALRVQFRHEGRWQMARLAHLGMGDAVEVGPVCCSPTRAGLEVAFTRFEIGPPIDRALHD